MLHLDRTLRQEEVNELINLHLVPLVLTDAIVVLVFKELWSHHRFHHSVSQQLRMATLVLYFCQQGLMETMAAVGHLLELSQVALDLVRPHYSVQDPNKSDLDILGEDTP